MRFFYCFFAAILLLGCGRDNGVKVWFSPSDHVVDVSGRIRYVEQGEIYGTVYLHILDSILIVQELYPQGDNFLHLYNKNTFKHLVYAGVLGKGPNEVVRQGYITPNMDSTAFWLWDAGRDVQWLFPLDSLLSKPGYKPTEFVKLDPINSICRFVMLDDSIFFGIVWKSTRSSTFRTDMAKFNIRTGEVERYGYQHDELSDKHSNSLFACSKTHGVYVHAHCNCQLLSVFNLDGSLRCEAVGDDYGDDVQRRRDYFGHVYFAGSKVVVEYNGGDSFKLDKHQRMETTWPTRLLVFDIDGRHRATIETGHEIVSFCIDEENHRVICYFNNTEHPLGYFSFDFEKDVE